MPPTQGHQQSQPAEQADREPEPHGTGLLARLAQLPDPRSRRGRRYPLPALLGIAVAAVLSGARTYTEVAEFAAELSQQQLATLGVPKRAWEARYQTPKETALRRLLQRLDADTLDELVGGWLAEQLPDGEDAAVAVDGKTLRGAAGTGTGTGGHRPHLLAALVHGHGTVVAQRQVDAKTSEIGGFGPLLDQVELAGRVVTADALHTQATHARYLVEDRQAAYLLVVKGNQPGLVKAIDELPEPAFSPGVSDN
jgi:DDE_Tnp_1-associated/Transposase DDE domain